MAFLSSDGTAPGALVGDLLSQGCVVLAIDCFATGEHVAPDAAPSRDLDRSFFDASNRTDMAEQVYDIADALAYLAKQPDVQNIGLAGAGRAGLWCLLAAPFASSKLHATAVDVAGFDTTRDDGYTAPETYIPCLRRAGDFCTAMVLIAPHKLLVHNTQAKFDASYAQVAYRAAGASDALRVSETPATDAEIAQWLMKAQ